MEDKNYYMQQPIDRDGIAPVYNPSMMQRSPHGVFSNTPMGINVGQYFNNNTIQSKYTGELGDVNAAIRAGRTIEDLLAEKQSGWEMAGNALVNNAVIAGTTMISGTLGIVDGIFEALTNGEASKLWDNSINNWAVDTQEAAKEYFPIYRGDEYNNASIWEKMGTGIFWADLVENLGFTEGMLVPGMAASRVFQALGKGATMLGGAFVSSLGEGSIEAINERNDEVKNKTAIANQKYNELAAQASDSELPELYDDYLKTVQDIEDDANNAGNFTLGANLALLTLTNTVEFGNLFSRGFSTGRKIAGQLTRDGEKYIADSGAKAIAKAFGKKVVDAFSEGMEEVSQSAISGAAQYYTDYNKFNESIFNPEKRELVGNLLSAFGESYANTLQDPQTAAEFASGFITGLAGVPQLRRAKIPVKLENNILGDLYSAYKNNKREQELANTINDRLANSKQFNSYYNGLVRHLSIQDDINTALDEADHTAFDNAKSAQLISDIMMFSDAGHIDHLKELVNNSVDLSDEGINSIIEETSKDGNGPFMSNGNKMSVDDVRELIKRKQEYINHKIDFISKSKNELEAAFPNLNETGIENAVFLKSQIEDHQTRFDSLVKEARAGIVRLFNSYINKDIENKSKRGKGNSRKGTKYVTTSDGRKHYVNPEDIDYIEDDGTVVLKENKSSRIEANPYKKFIPTEEELVSSLNNPAFAILVQDLLNSDSSTMAHDEKVKLSETLKDLGKLQVGLIELNKNLAETIKNPDKANNSKQQAIDKKEKANEVHEGIKIKDKINNSSVSDIVQGMESGDLDQSQLDGLFTEEDNEFLSQTGKKDSDSQKTQSSGKQKIEEAKKILKTTSRMDEIINNLDDGSIDPQALADAQKLLKNSKSVSQSEQELLDTATQAYNDPLTLFDELDPSMQGITQEESESSLKGRIDKAKSVIEQAKAILAEQNDELNDLPEGSTVERSMGAEELEKDRSTGHDATDKVKTENEKKKEDEAKKAQQEAKAKEESKVDGLFNEARANLPEGSLDTFNNTLPEVLDYIDKLIEANTPNKDIGKIVKNTQSYKILEQLVPDIGKYLNAYITLKTSPEKQEIQPQQQQQQQERVITPTVTEEEIRRESTRQQASNPNRGELTGTYQYWKPTTSRIGQHNLKGDNTPYYIVARHLTNAFAKKAAGKVLNLEEQLYWDTYVAPGHVKFPYTEEQLQRMETIYKYLDEHGTFKLIDNDAARGTIQFVIDSSLNEKVGETVILMADSQGRILGDVMSPKDYGFDNQLGLPQFVERVTKEYTDMGSPQYFTSKESTTVDKNMVGKVPYSADHEVMNTLNDIHSDGGTPIPFLIGVAATSGQNARILASAGRIKKQGQSNLEKSINPPLTAKAGQPFLLVPTSSAVNHYMATPFVMESYNPNTQNTALGRAIHKVLERIPVSDNSNAMSIINALEELISVQEIHINYNGDNVKITIKPIGAEHQRVIHDGDKNNPTIVDQIEYGLQVQQLPFQVSRKYMNESYEGQDYNRMIGEVAKTNLPIGATHTISDWFTVKPLNAAGEQMKAKSPRSTGKNPNAAEIPMVSVQRNGTQLYVNSKTWEVTDGKKTYEGPNADKVKAQAFGIYTNQNMEKPYDTAWGYYDPKADEFIEKPNVVLRTLGAPSVTPEQSHIETLVAWAEDKISTEEAIKRLDGTEYVKHTRGSKLLHTTDGVHLATMNGPVEVALGKYIIEKYPFLHYGSVNEKAEGMFRGTNLTVITDDEGNEYGTPSNFLHSLAKNGKAAEVVKRLSTSQVAKTSGGPQVTTQTMAESPSNTVSTAEANTQQSETPVTITYTPIGKQQQTYEIRGSKIYNKNGQEVFKEDSKDRRKIFANLAVKEGRAVVVEHKGKQYVVNNRNDIISVVSGDLMKWGEENGDRKAVLQAAREKFAARQQAVVPKTPSTPSASTTENETPAQLEDKAKKAGLLGNKVRQALWQVLTPDQQATIANKRGPKQKQWMDALESAFNATNNTFDENKLKGSVDDFLGRKALYRETDGSQDLWNKEKELGWMKKALPNLSTSEHLTIIDRLIEINDSKNSGKAYGKFQEGMITISDLAARGTAYHEAFHAVVHTLLSNEEYQKLFDAASERWKDIQNPIKLEEELAEDFRRFMQSEEDWYDSLDEKGYGTIRKTLAVLFHKLKNLINELSGKTPYINKLYYGINRGKFARRKVSQTDVTRFSEESYTTEMQSIKDKAVADGTFMKAPNGNPTNLTERQWLQVRTKNFINWFGDWINDPANASKVVDENGEPLVVYHGGAAGIKAFDKSKLGEYTKATSAKMGFFFSSNKMVSETYIRDGGWKYRGKLLELENKYKSIEKNADAEFHAANKALLEALNRQGRFFEKLRDFAKRITDKNYIPLKQQISNLQKESDALFEKATKIKGSITHTKEYEEFREFVEEANNDVNLFLENYAIEHREGTDIYEVFLNIKNPGIRDYITDKTDSGRFYSDTIKEKINEGRDGVILTNVEDVNIFKSRNIGDIFVGTDYVVFEPNQIKSATDNIGTFSTENDDIRYRMVDGFGGTIQEFQEIADSNINNPALRWKDSISKKRAWNRLVDIWRSEGYIVNGSPKKGKWIVTSVQDLNQSYYSRVEQYHRDKLLYSNLSQENKDYLDERGITLEEYNQMTQLEKEVLFRCKY